MERYPFREQRVRPDTFIAFGVGVVLAYLVLPREQFQFKAVLETLIVLVPGGLWYWWRKIV
jgi:hypothetical protein